MTTADTYLKFIELIAYWEGSVNTSHLIKYFDISRQQAGKYIDKYQQIAPQNLLYSRKLKTYSASAQFCLQFSTPNVGEYLHWAQGNPEGSQPVLLPIEKLLIPQREIDPHIMRALIAAIRNDCSVTIPYHSLSKPAGQQRAIAPHRFVFTGLRWHVRALCETSNTYRDFVLNRFSGSAQINQQNRYNHQNDLGWHTLVDVVIAADSRLTQEQQQIIQVDYQMKNGQLNIPIRACLVGYLLQSLRISTKVIDASPEAQQLICRNLRDLKPWLFE